MFLFKSIKKMLLYTNNYIPSYTIYLLTIHSYPVNAPLDVLVLDVSLWSKECGTLTLCLTTSQYSDTVCTSVT